MKKIIYFDENSATDYLVIQNGGALVFSDSDAQKTGDTVELNVGAKLKLLFNSLFVSGSAKIDSKVGIYASGENLIKTTITNTTLSDFLELVTTENKDIITLDGYHVEIVPGSIAEFQTITPYLAMAEGQIRVDEDLAISMNKMYDTLKLGKGYYELLGKNKENSTCILRFNNSSFKNNYGITDLLMMDLLFVCMEVGKGKVSQLDFAYAFDTKKGQVYTNIEEMENENSECKTDDIVPIYDVILAGVK